MFCNGVVRTNLRYAVASTVSGNLTNFTNIYGLTATDKGSGGNLVIATIADPATFIQNRKLEQFFEGDTDNAKVDLCVLTYKDIISHVSEQSDES
jgi:hypothetical protein